MVQLQSLVDKERYEADAHLRSASEQPDWEHVKTFLELLPFALMRAQKRALKDILEDVHRPQPMMRLMQWDVGSWKTVVATAAARYCITKFGQQAAFMAPIEVLAQQHFKTLAKLLLPLGIRVALLTWSTSASEKATIKQGLASGAVQFVIGTHAIIQKDVSFANLWFAIIDEQHKFGVRQRAYLQSHGAPHLLQMTATPIPRSLAMAYFGEFNVSTIDEMPVGRKPIITKIVTESDFITMKPRVLTKIAQWQRVFCITPLIEDSDSEGLEDVKSATQHYEQLKQLYPEMATKIGLLHGKMKSADKDEIMKRFKLGTYTMLVSTTVIEVGIDVPEATIMIIYNAERFGLSQLHQLRGRVWRSTIQSYCFLETSKKSGETYQRIKHLETVADGFTLSELDLQYRGPWEFLWIRQSWETDVPLDILTDTALIEQVQTIAQELMQTKRNAVERLLNLENEAGSVMA